MAQDKLKTFKGVFLKESASTRTMILSMKNKYIYHSRISEKKFREILKYFAQDIEATKIANLTGISKISINKILKSIRVLMSKEREKISKFSDEIEIDESYFGAKRVRGLVLALSLRKEVEAQQIKHQYLECLKETVGFILK